MSVPNISLLPTPPSVKTSAGLRRTGGDEALQPSVNVKGNVPPTNLATLAPVRISTFERSIEAIDIENRIEDSRRATKEKYLDLTSGVAREKARELAQKATGTKAGDPAEDDASVGSARKKPGIDSKQSADVKVVPASEKQKPGVRVSSEIARAQIEDFVKKSDEKRAGQKVAATSKGAPEGPSKEPHSKAASDSKAAGSHGEEASAAPAKKIKEEQVQQKREERGAKAVISEQRGASETENAVKRKAEAEKNKTKEDEVQIRKFERKKSELFLKTGLQEDYREIAAQSKRGEDRAKLEATFKKTAAKKEERLAHVDVRSAETEAASQLAQARDTNSREAQKNIQNREIAAKVPS